MHVNLFAGYPPPLRGFWTPNGVIFNFFWTNDCDRINNDGTIKIVADMMKTDNFEIFEEYSELKNDAMGVSEGCQSRILGTRFSKKKLKIFFLKFFFDIF